MERKLQQRLVGIVILAAFALLIAPVLLDGEGRIPQKITDIPPEPVRPDLSHIQNRPIVPAVADDIAEAEVPEEPVTTEPQRTDTTAAAPEVSLTPAKSDTESAASAIRLWSVQVASFKDSARAVALRDKLRSEGFKTYVREKLLSDDTLFTQVFVGPVESKEDADSLKAQVKTRVQLQGLVVRYRDR